MGGSTNTDDNCLFCKIIAGDIPGDIVYQDKHLVAFKDIAPKAPLHVLVVPRDHAPNIAASTARHPKLAGRLIAAAGDIAVNAGHPDYNLLFNTGAGAGQTVFHTHLHLLAGGLLTELPV
jgi:histidine triad (HIT) family protein